MRKFGFEEYGRVYVPISIKPLDDITLPEVRFKVDTGADTTTISKRDLARLGYDADWIKQNAVIYKDNDKPTTAAGEKINAGYVQLPLINILGYEGKNWAFQIIMDEKQDFRNLLGRDCSRALIIISTTTTTFSASPEQKHSNRDINSCPTKK